MAEVFAFAEVRLWGERVGGVAETDDGAIVFEYDETFRRAGYDISPINLPRSLTGPVRFEELRRKEAFRGLPGVLADALPDAFGRKVIRAYYTARGALRKALSPVQHLLYVGERAIGALEFQPAEELAARAAEADALEVAALVADARRIVAGEAAVAIPHIYRIGSSAGGVRPKAVVLYNPETSEVRSAFAPGEPGDVSAILKFDGVGPDSAEDQLGRPRPYNRVEAAYATMARDAGLDVVDVMILESDEGHAHLIIPRFDQPGQRPLHQHTLGGMLHVDYNEPGASSYEEYLRTILYLGMPHASVIEGYRRMVFNVLAVNQDDHVKNLSFHMDSTGTWTLAPAYDVTFARGRGFTASHQMRVADKRDGIERADLLEVAATFGIRRPETIVSRIEEVVADWPAYAERTAVPKETVEAVGAALKERAERVRR